MRFEQLLQIARRRLQRIGQIVKSPARKMQRDKAGNVRALSCLVIKGERDGAFSFKRAETRKNYFAPFAGSIWLRCRAKSSPVSA